MNIQDQIEKMLNMTESDPYSPNFESFGIDNMNFFLNSGSFFALMTLIITYYILKGMISCFMRICPKFKIARKIGVWAYNKNSLLEFRQAVTRL